MGFSQSCVCTIFILINNLPMQNELLLLHKILLCAEIIFNEQTFFFSFSLPCQTHAVCHTSESRQSHLVIDHFYKFQEKIARSNWKSGRSWPMTDRNFNHWTCFTHSSGVSVVGFGQVIGSRTIKWMAYESLWKKTQQKPLGLNISAWPTHCCYWLVDFDFY